MERLTPSEEEALSALWKTNPGFIKEVLGQLPCPAPPYTTLASTFRSLERKQYVSAEKLGNSYRYTALVSAQEYRRRSLGALVRAHFRDSYKELVSFFVAEEKLSPADLEELIQLLEQQKPEQS